jgi:hypothetical protein
MPATTSAGRTGLNTSNLQPVTGTKVDSFNTKRTGPVADVDKCVDTRGGTGAIGSWELT